MSRMNYSRVNMQKRVAYERRIYDQPPIYARKSGLHNGYSKAGYSKSLRPARWLKIYFGRHKGKTLPKILIEDPEYVICYLYSDIGLFKKLKKGTPTGYQKEIAHQLEVLKNRAANILPQAGSEFLIVVDRDGVFKRFAIVKKGRALKRQLRKGSKIVERVPLLNVALPLDYKNSELGFERMARCIRRMCFGDSNYEPSADEAGQCFSDDDHFDLSALDSHTTIKSTTRDHRILMKKVRQ